MYTNMIKGFLVGGVIAAGVALLLAPKSGSEIRQDIKTGLVEAGNKTNQLLGDASQRAKQAVLEAKDEVSRRVTQVTEETKAAANNAKKSAREIANEQM